MGEIFKKLVNNIKNRFSKWQKKYQIRMKRKSRKRKMRLLSKRVLKDKRKKQSIK